MLEALKSLLFSSDNLAKVATTGETTSFTDSMVGLYWRMISHFESPDRSTEI